MRDSLYKRVKRKHSDEGLAQLEYGGARNIARPSSDTHENDFEMIDNNMIGGGKKKEFKPPSWATPPSHHRLTPAKVTSGYPRFFCHVCDHAFANKGLYKEHVKQYPRHKKSGADKMRETNLFKRGKLASDKILESRGTLMFGHPFCMQVVGPSRSGKTYWLSQLLRDRAQYIRPAPEKVLYCYAHWQPAYDLMQDEGIEFHEGLPSSISISSLSDCLLVLDDLMDVAVNDKKLMSLCTEGSHHKNISVVFMMQNLYPHGRESKTISLNMTYLVIFKMVRDKLQVKTLARQLFPGKMGDFMDYYNEMISKPYGKLILDLHPRTPDNQRYIQDKVTFDNMDYDDDTSDDSDNDEALEFFKKQEAKNNQVLKMTNPYLSAVLTEQKKINEILQDPSLEDDEKVIAFTNAQRDSRIYMENMEENMNPIPPPTTLIPPVSAPVPVPRVVTPPPAKDPTLVGLVKEYIPYEDLLKKVVPTQQELRDDSGDENFMDNWASLSDGEEMGIAKEMRADYRYRDRTLNKRKIAEQARADTAPRAVRKSTFAGLIKEDTPYQDLPVPTHQELRDDSGDENFMDNWASLSDSEEMDNLKKIRADYRFRDRNKIKRAREYKYQPYNV